MSRARKSGLKRTDSDQDASPHLRTWVKERMDVEERLKRALACHVVTHWPLKLGTGLLMGSGTGNIILMAEIIKGQFESKRALDLAIVTNNMQVFYKMRDARQEFGAIFGDTQLSLTAGTLRPSLDSLVGRAAEESIKDARFFPDRVIFGAKNITFQNGALKLSYQFEDELGVQEALAQRPTTTRFLIADHTKFGLQSTYQANIGLKNLLLDAQTCLVLTTVNDSAEPILAREEQALQLLLKELAGDEEFDSKEFIFRLIHEDGRVCRETTLSDVRARVHASRVGADKRAKQRLALVEAEASSSTLKSHRVNGRA